MLNNLPPTVRSTSAREVTLLDIDPTYEAARLRGVVMAMKTALAATFWSLSFLT
jgi:hypothetical protein